MRVNSGVEIAGLRHRCADGAVRTEAMNGHAARRVVGRQQVAAAAVDARVDRARRQRHRIAMRPQRCRRRIDRERAGIMLVAGKAWSAAARHHVQKTPQRMRPGILNAGGQRDRAACAQGCGVDVDIITRKRRSDAAVIHCLGHGSGSVVTVRTCGARVEWTGSKDTAPQNIRQICRGSENYGLPRRSKRALDSASDRPARRCGRRCGNAPASCHGPEFSPRIQSRPRASG